MSDSALRQQRIKILQPGGEYLVGLLNEYRAAWALIRQWTGHDPAIAQREEHIKRLEHLVWDAIYALQAAELDDEAHRLRRAIAPEWLPAFRSPASIPRDRSASGIRGLAVFASFWDGGRRRRIPPQAARASDREGWARATQVLTALDAERSWTGS